MCWIPAFTTCISGWRCICTGIRTEWNWGKTILRDAHSRLVVGNGRKRLFFVWRWTNHILIMLSETPCRKELHWWRSFVCWTRLIWRTSQGIKNHGRSIWRLETSTCRCETVLARWQLFWLHSSLFHWNLAAKQRRLEVLNARWMMRFSKQCFHFYLSL